MKILGVLLAVAAGMMVAMVRHGQVKAAEPAPTTTKVMKGQAMETAIFGAGCFWGVEATFRALPGVTATRVGYAGGTVEHPSYEQICGGRTGHTEVVEVTYDPAQVTYAQLLVAFFTCHDPSEQHKTQYRSVIFYHTPAQRETAETAKARLQAAGKVVQTAIESAPVFYQAEEYHQQYYEKHGIKGMCGGH